MVIKEELWLLVELVISAVLGFIIGFERKLRYKEAGIRTHTIVCVGSALIMIVSKHAFSTDFDTSRVAAQIVSGVGFLGAGMIVYRKSGVSGLTTAAGVWTTAGVGMACGGGLYFLAIGATALIVFLQCLFHINCRAFNRKRYYTVKMSYHYASENTARIKEIFNTDKFNHFVVKREGDNLICNVKLNTDKEYASSQIQKIIEENNFIIFIERGENE